MQYFHGWSTAVRIWRFWGGDAILVGVLWQQVLCDGVSGSSRFVLATVLGTAICGIYALDHLWDHRRDNHSFVAKEVAGRRRVSLEMLQARSGWMALLLLATSGFLAWQSLPREVILYGGVLFLLCVGYYGVRTYWPGWQVGRDAVLALIFAGGVVGPLLVLGVEIPLPVVLALLALLLANARICLLEDNLQGQVRSWATILLILLGGAKFFQAAWEVGFPAETALAGILSALLLLPVPGCSRSTFCPFSAQPLADTALWLPAAGLLLFRAH